jgi:hypothetical protein
MDKKPKFSATGIPENIDLPAESQENPLSSKNSRLNMNDIMKGLGGVGGGDVSAMIETVMHMLAQPDIQREIEQASSGIDPLLGKEITAVNRPEDLLAKKDEFSKTSCMDYNSLISSESFGMIDCDTSNDILSDFNKTFKTNPLGFYPMQLFTNPDASITGFNLLDDMANINGFKYVSHNERYILLETIANSEDKEPYIVAVVKNNEEFSIIIPDFGNSYNTNDRIMFDKILDVDLYEINEVNGKSEFKYRYNLNKINDGLNLLLFSKKVPILSISQFGKIVRTGANEERRNISNGEVYIGKIKANDSKIAVMFKRDFNLREDQTIFEFYVKLKGNYTPDAEFLLADLLREVDFNTNRRMQTLELNADSNGRIYVVLDLGDTPNNLPKYFEE